MLQFKMLSLFTLKQKVMLIQMGKPLPFYGLETKQEAETKNKVERQ